jgi:hypothetical protein
MILGIRVIMDSNTLTWLLEPSNPAVKYRTQTELLGLHTGNEELKKTRAALLASDLTQSAMKLFDVGKTFMDIHALSALSEYGLTRNDVDIDRYADRLIEETGFHDGCGEWIILRNLVVLGYANHPAVKKELLVIFATQQSDGGFPCISKNSKINKPGVLHKSCFQVSVGYLLLAAELAKMNIACPYTDDILRYFLERELLYRHDTPDVMVRNVMGMTFHPPVATRVGLHMILHAISVFGKGNDTRCNHAWELLDKRRDADGRYLLDGSLTKPYIKLEKPGKPSKWVTFYALLAEKERSETI